MIFSVFVVQQQTSNRGEGGRRRSSGPRRVKQEFIGFRDFGAGEIVPISRCWFTYGFALRRFPKSKLLIFPTN